MSETLRTDLSGRRPFESVEKRGFFLDHGVFYFLDLPMDRGNGITIPHPYATAEAQ